MLKSRFVQKSHLQFFKRTSVFYLIRAAEHHYASIDVHRDKIFLVFTFSLSYADKNKFLVKHRVRQSTQYPALIHS